MIVSAPALQRDTLDLLRFDFASADLAAMRLKHVGPPLRLSSLRRRLSLWLEQPL